MTTLLIIAGANQLYLLRSLSHRNFHEEAKDN